MYIPPIRVGDSFSIVLESGVDPSTGDTISEANGWSAKLCIKGNGCNLEKTASSGWVVNLSTTDTSSLIKGFAAYAIKATKASSEITIDSGRIEILPNVFSANGTFEYRSQARQDLEAVQAAIRAFISKGAISDYSINGRSLKRCSLADLTALESRLMLRVKREERAEANKNGVPSGRVSFVRFK